MVTVDLTNFEIRYLIAKTMEAIAPDIPIGPRELPKVDIVTELERLLELAYLIEDGN